MAHISWDSLSEVERSLAAAVCSGELLDLTDGPDQRIRAEVIRALLLNKLPLPDESEPDPKGVRVRGVELVGQLDLADVTSSLPLVLLSCVTDAPVVLRRAHLSSVDLSGLVAPAVDAAWLYVEHYVYAVEACIKAEGVAFNLAEANVGGHINLTGANLASSGASALHAPKLRTGSDVFLSGLQASGTGDHGAVCVHGADIGGTLDCQGATLQNTVTGPALHATDVRVENSVALGGGFTASGSGPKGVIRMKGARLGGDLRLVGGHAMATDGGLALNLRRVNIAGVLWLPKSFADGQLRLNGLTYASVPLGADVHEWLEMLSTRTPDFTAQPYSQLAAVHQSSGNEREARRIHMARQRDLVRRGSLSRPSRLWYRITGLTVGYGYRPSTALSWLIGTLVTAILAVTAIAGPTHALQGSCSLVEQIGLALDAITPLAPATKVGCQIDLATGAGKAITATLWVLQVLAWAFATLFIAGFTGLVRRN